MKVCLVNWLLSGTDIVASSVFVAVLKVYADFDLTFIIHCFLLCIFSLLRETPVHPLQALR